jgi:hypothetical protein
MSNYSETSEDQFYYRAKYLKYKQKYLELKGGNTVSGILKVSSIVDPIGNAVKILKITVKDQVICKSTNGKNVTLHPSYKYDMTQKAGTTNNYIITKTYYHNDKKKARVPEQIEVTVVDSEFSEMFSLTETIKTTNTTNTTKQTNLLTEVHKSKDFTFTCTSGTTTSTTTRGVI